MLDAEDAKLIIAEAKSNYKKEFGVYEGDFLNNMRSGKGRMEWASGGCYEGDFLDNSRSGKGRMTWPSGEYYEGDFIDGKMEGTGTYYAADGSVKYSGQWIQDCPVGNS